MYHNRKETAFAAAKVNDEEEKVTIAITDSRGAVLFCESFKAIDEAFKERINKVLEPLKTLVVYDRESVSFLLKTFNEKNDKKFSPLIQSQNNGGRRPPMKVSDDDEEDENELFVFLNVFSALVGDYSKSGRPKQQKFEKAFEYFNISANCNINDATSIASALAKIWDTMCPDFYENR